LKPNGLIPSNVVDPRQHFEMLLAICQRADEEKDDLNRGIVNGIERDAVKIDANCADK
jgi:hypothetical protein